MAVGESQMIVKFNYYQKLFQGPKLPYLISDIFSQHYRTLKCLLIFKDGMWTSYLPKEVVMQTLKDGLKIYGDDKNLKEYIRNYDEYKKSAIKFFQKLTECKTISREDLKKVIECTAKNWHYYSRTEFFYTDSVFIESQNNPKIKKNLKFVEEIKNSGRIFMNNIFFGEDAYFKKILMILSKQFNISTDLLMQYNTKELVGVYDGCRASDQDLQLREKIYVVIGDGKNVNTYIGKEAEKLAAEFMSNIKRDIKELKGVAANKGKISGKVKIILVGYENFNKINQMINEMNEGDILVSDTTVPELIMACKKAGAIVTNQGGLMSHAAIVSRELGIPCIVGTGNATDILKDGDLVEVDADKGIVRIIK